jgi:hypothetical protein
MAERAELFDEDLDLSGFTPKKPVKSAEPPPDMVRKVSEEASFRSREPAALKRIRRRRTGRSQQFNIKLRGETIDAINRITDEQKYSCLGETIERMVEALERELSHGQQK